MKYLIIIFSVLFFIGCTWTQNKDANIEVTWKVAYGSWECDMSQKDAYRRLSAYTGRIFFIKESEIQDMYLKLDGFTPEPNSDMNYEKYQMQLFNALKEKSIVGVVMWGKYAARVAPWSYKVITEKSDLVNQSAMFSTGSVSVGKDFNFYECLKK